MLIDSPSWPPNPWITTPAPATVSPAILSPRRRSEPASPDIETAERWRQRMESYAPNQGWRFVLDHPTDPPPKSARRLRVEERNELAQELCKLNAQGLLEQFKEERKLSQKYSERYLAVREKATLYPGEDIDDDPMLSQVVLQNEIQLEINDAITHLESLLAIISHIQKTLPVNIFQAEAKDSIESFWSDWKPTWNDAVNLWTLSCILSSILLYTERLSFLQIIFVVLFLISLILMTVFITPYIWRWYRARRIDTLRTGILKLWYSFRTDPTSIDADSILVLREGRFWVLGWYLTGRQDSTLSLGQSPITDAEKVTGTRLSSLWERGLEPETGRVRKAKFCWEVNSLVFAVTVSVRISIGNREGRDKAHVDEHCGNYTKEPCGGLDLEYYFTER